MTFHEKLSVLCANAGKSVTGLLGELGIAKSAAYKWKTSGAVPAPSTIKKIADYFNVPITYFVEGAPTVIHDNHGFIGENNATVTFVQNEKKDEQTLALLELWEKMDVLKKAQLIAYAISLSKE